MKTKPEGKIAAALPIANNPPSASDLQAMLGPAADVVEKVVSTLRAVQPGVTIAWQLSPKVGWYQIHLLKRRRLFYLVPKAGDFRLSLILGGKALALLQQGPFARQTARLLKTAKRYPEGTAFSFDRGTLDPKLMSAFLAAKIAY